MIRRQLQIENACIYLQENQVGACGCLGILSTRMSDGDVDDGGEECLHTFLNDEKQRKSAGSTNKCSKVGRTYTRITV